jgi:hypothetical protein
VSALRQPDPPCRLVLAAHATRRQEESSAAMLAIDRATMTHVRLPLDQGCGHWTPC